MKIAVISHNLKYAGGLSVATNIIKQFNEIEYNCKFFFVIPEIKDYINIKYKRKNEIYIVKSNLSWFFRVFFELYLLPKYLKKFNPDHIICLGNYPLIRTNSKQSILFHKPHLLYPSIYSKNELLIKKIKNFLLKTYLRLTLWKVSIVFCQTDVALIRFKKYFKFKKEIVKIPNVISKNINKFQVASNNNIIPEQYNDKFIVFVLTKYYPHKNLEILIDLCYKYNKLLDDFVFITTISACDHPKAKNFLYEINNNIIAKKIFNIGYVKQQDLAYFYNKSDCVLLPTFLESFSGVYIEAMTFKVPLITSNLDFAINTCGLSALYFDPFSVESLFEALILLKNYTFFSRILQNNMLDTLNQNNNSWNKNVHLILNKIHEV